MTPRALITQMLKALEVATTPLAKDRQEVLAAITAAREYLAAPEQSELGYATRLAEAIYKQHYKDDAPEWKPMPDLMGVLTQIDNMFADLYTHPAPKAEPVNQTLLNALKEVQRTLHDANETGGSITDTIWYSPHETLFDYMAAAITAAEQAPQPAELTDAEILAANHPDGVENGETISRPDYELIAFGRQVLAAQGAKP